MRLTIKKMHNGNVIDESEYSFNDVDEYISFLDSIDVDMSLEDAEFDMQQSNVQYRIPLAAKEVQ